MLSEQWVALWGRVQRRAIRVIDIVTILIADGLIMALGYRLVRFGTHFLSNSGSTFFDAAKEVSEGVFLLLYMAFITFDIGEYVRSEGLFKQHERPMRGQAAVRR